MIFKDLNKKLRQRNKKIIKEVYKEVESIHNIFNN